MPELPEVETVVRDMRRAKFLGEKITSVQIHAPKLVHVGNAQLLVNQSFTKVYRQAKFICLDLNSKMSLLIHLRMTGKIHVISSDEPIRAYEMGRICFANVALCYCDVRTFGRWYVVEDVTAFLAHLGQDPLDPAFDEKRFIQALGSCKKRLKSLLLDQTILAGLGNIYADEALFHARLHPLRTADSLSKKEALVLVAAIQRVLTEAIDLGGSSLGSGKGNFQSVYSGYGKNQERFCVYQRTGQSCLQCQTTIQRIVVNQRSTHFCPTCQQRQQAKPPS